MGILIIYIFKVGQFAHNSTLDRDGGLVERSSCAAAGRGPSRARVNKQAKSLFGEISERRNTKTPTDRTVIVCVYVRCECSVVH